MLSLSIILIIICVPAAVILILFDNIYAPTIPKQNLNKTEEDFSHLDFQPLSN
jgi:hypothetical protein